MHQPAKQLPRTTNREVMGGTSSTSRSARSGAQEESVPAASKARTAFNVSMYRLPNQDAHSVDPLMAREGDLSRGSP